MKFLIDTNVLLRWSDADSVAHQVSRGAVARLADSGGEAHICAQVAIEYWVSATRPVDVNGFGLSYSEANRNITEIAAAFPCLPELPCIFDLWREMVNGYGVMGKQAHDARIAALMLAHGVTHILTLNPQDFARYEGITPVTPAEVVNSPAQ